MRSRHGPAFISRWSFADAPRLDRIILPGSAITTEAAAQREYPIGDGLAGAPRYWLDLSIRLLVLALLGLGRVCKSSRSRTLNRYRHGGSVSKSPSFERRPIPTRVLEAAASDTRPRRKTMPELIVDVITSLDGYGEAEGWPGWWVLEGPEYLGWLGQQPERNYAILMGAKTFA